MGVLAHIVFLCLHVAVFVKTQTSKTIIDDPECYEVKSLCNNLAENNDILILECLQSISPTRLTGIKKSCEHVIWTHTSELIKSKNVYNALSPFCSNDFKTIKCAPSDHDYLKCLVGSKEQIQAPGCKNMLDRIEGVAFLDYSWISSFLAHCTEDIEKQKCGSIDTYGFSQAKTLTCLQTKMSIIDDSCKREVFRLSEIQADNLKLDQQLYTACKEDHMRMCQLLPVGSARVLNCLMRQDPTRLTPACQANLLRRQRLIAQDYRISKGLMRACKDDIKKMHCRKQTSGDKTIRLAQILLCLEGVMRNGTKLDPGCQNEMADHRRMLMEDYRLSPEIVDGCKNEIRNYCEGFETGSRTIHCLMDHARAVKHHSKQIDEVCRRALEALVKETDAGEDWRVDPVLQEACLPVVKVHCKGLKGGDARVMSCLMNNIGTDNMVEPCEEALMQIQYFVARDFKLDPQLYRACKHHAQKVCHAGSSWNSDEKDEPSYGPQVLPCLYRYAYHNELDLKLSKSCLQQVRRVMKQRAQSVDLQPEIEEPCLSDLAEFCFDKTKKGEEVQCLQDNLDHLTERCQNAVEEFTEIEGEHAELNPYIMANCQREMEMFCSSELKNDEGDVMECLIAHKNDPYMRAKPACRASIEHFQIISLKNYRFTYKFKMACKTHAMRFCSKAKTKSDVIACLSERITNDTIRGEKSVIPKECRQQLKAQLFQQRENINFDPKLKAACSSDINSYCSHVEQGNAQILECLQSVHKKLTDSCEREVFKVKKQEINDNSVDYALMSVCADTIEDFCPNHDKKNVLECLERNKDQKGFTKKCRLVVLHRLIEQHTNYQLNPSLQENCKPDINKFCKNVTPNQGNKDINGPIIKCLKLSFKRGKLSNKCEKEMAHILREEVLDINLNPLLRVVCKNELETICRSDEVSDIEECLKKSLMAKKIATPACQNEVANMIEESQVDIQVDPLLQEACALDLLTHCTNVPQGNGRHIKCLKDINSKSLSPDCRDMLNKRLEMYKNAALYAAPPEDLQQLYVQVVTSPSKHYLFLMILTMVASIFVIGIFCGRISKRHMLIKNK